LPGPGVRQANSFEARRSELDRLPAIENGLDDVRREEGEWQNTTDVRLMHGVPASKIGNRSNVTAAKLVEPLMTLHDSGDERV
jgi:hypothetical protein